VLLAKEGTELQDVINRLTENERCCGMEMNVGKTKVMRTSREPSPLQIIIDNKQLQNVEYFNCLRSITNDASCTLK
jgi:hypothetical protein